jgi:hypothetical protein
MALGRQGERQVAAEVHPADQGDTATLPGTLAAAEANWFCCKACRPAGIG